ncbi:MAG: SPOR domain-containing protein [Candidatus Cloacimonetes bacterium]|nr:SPOR domain-containing protein [Candidatus Cloacimonadota bacterium]MDY0367891.1 SPOR domain-containing protein [Candidatus Syntrophosphaera sp.]
MPRDPRFILALLLLALLPLTALAVDFRREFQTVEDLWLQGKLEELPGQLYKNVAKNDEERALQTYLNAMLKQSKDDTLILLKQAADRYPSTHYGQQSMLEMAKLHILEREIPAAETLLKKISSPELPERFYWLAYCAQYRDDHAAAIAQGENYLRAAPNGRFAEDSHYIIAGAYQNQNKFFSAISSLEKLRALPGLPKNQQYFHYLLGRNHHQNGNCAEAFLNYKTAFELNRKSQLAFEIEDRLHELKGRYGSQVDLSFLYPYTELELPELVPEPVLEPLPAQAEVDPTAPARLEAKPSGIHVQAGRFGKEENAGSRTAELRALKVKANYFEDKGNKTVPWVVVSGPYPSQSEADCVARLLRANSIDCFITRF